MDKKQLISFFDGLAGAWDLKESAGAFGLLEQIVRKINIRQDDFVLDIGCGTGVLRPFILAYNPQEILHMDVSLKMLEELNKKFPDAQTLAADFETEILPRNYFDKAVAYNVFPHFSDHENVFYNAHACLKPGGVFVIAHSQTRGELNRAHGKHDATKRDLLPAGEKIYELYQNAGFKNITVRERDPGFFSSGFKDLL
ncbi:MAG: methyltransferase domain-containing protein [Elusimicrobium sp.]|jgi:demethylmenaquinone methyltransferase/2-methoxy-6-polyprenyl-1,4-benzoquinol methylase|nr:methyltransferase domain-containing protein [Elusimicrobium sp.]